MTSVIRVVRKLGGVARVRALRDEGVAEGVVRAFVRAGLLRSIRTGWVCTPDAPPEVVAAVSLGGRLGCVSAARHHGLWTPDAPPVLHIARPSHSGRQYGDASGTVVHWQSCAWRQRENAVESVPALIRQVLLCGDRDDAICIIDSALNKKRLTLPQLRLILRGMPPQFTSVLDDVDRSSESGLETLSRLRFARLPLGIRSQVDIDEVGRVDLVIGDRLVIEADGRAWHEGPEAFLADRTRDLALIRRGYIVIRIGYEHIMTEWQLIELAVLELVSRREHLWSTAHRRAGLGGSGVGRDSRLPRNGSGG